MIMASELVKLTVQLVSSHASISELTSAELVEEIKAVYQTIAGLEAGQIEAAAPEEAPETKEAPPLEPAVPIEESVKDDHITCLVCGKNFRTLKAHLRRAHQLSPADYYKAYGLDPKRYPLVSRNYSEQRKSLAKKMGLGELRRRKKT
ncbi:MAG: MucR family transcriptional regulator [Deltaproteobacteria bacterium]|nr:MucR family transcriptional regulator [Deltaproteobacteria bacterium]MBW1952253.1 MucR family transcriptional regulator [Deltaproteobacteria bacterium]MBW2133960.1 MucR family transcriptional regulator [Deltaproteobacteria bacterium]